VTWEIADVGFVFDGGKPSSSVAPMVCRHCTRPPASQMVIA